MSTCRTLYSKIWDAHVIEQRSDGSCLLWVDRHVLNEGTSLQAFETLRAEGLTIERAAMHLAVADHAVPTLDREQPLPAGTRRDRIEQLERNCSDFGIPHIPYTSAGQGICHVIAPEQGFILPGMIAVCGDSHTATLGALGALGFGIGTSQIEQVLATGTLVQQPSRTLAVEIDGALPGGVGAKDVILHLIGLIGAGGASGHAIEYRGSAIAQMSIEGRITLSNMSIEAGARVGMIAPDQKLIEWLTGRPFCPKGAEWEDAVACWRSLHSDRGASFNRVIAIDAADIVPQVTWGTSPEHVAAVDGTVFQIPVALPILRAPPRRAGRKATRV